MVRKIRNQTIINPEDKKEGSYPQGKPKLNWISIKNNNGIVPKEVGEFVIEVLESIGEAFFPNVSFKGLSKQLKFYYYIPTLNVVIDFLENKETPTEEEELKEKQKFCKKMNLNRITISKNRYKNLISYLQNFVL